MDVCATEDTAKCMPFLTKQDNGLEHEWLTPAWMNPPYGREIGKWLKGAEKFCIQQFRNSDRTLDPKFQDIGHYHLNKLKDFKKIISKYIKKVEIRGA